MSASEDMAMQVRHRLARVRPVVDHQPIAGLFQPQFRGHFRSLEKQVSQHVMIAWDGLADAWNWPLWNDQHMNRRRWFNIFKG